MFIELGSKKNQEQTKKYLDTSEVFINNFSILGVKNWFVC